MQETKHFLNLVRRSEFDEALFFLANKNDLINKNYQDENKNTCLHIVIHSFVSKLEDIWSIYKNRSSLYGNQSDPQIQQTQEYKKKCLALIKQMFLDGFICREKNSDQKLPFEFFRNVCIKLYDVLQIEKDFIRIFETEKNFLYTGRKYVSDITLYRKRKKHNATEVKDQWTELNQRDGLEISLHQRLAIFEEYLRQNNISDPQNLVVANLGFLVSDKTRSKNNEFEIIFVSIPISDPDYLVINRDKFEDKSDGTHSEDALYSYLRSERLTLIIQKLKEKFPEKGHKIYGLVLDIHSTREVCRDCDSLLYRLQTDYDEKSFLKNIEILLQTDDYFLIPKKIACREKRDILHSDRNPKLLLTVRLDGLGDASAYGNQSNQYPAPIAHEVFISDIKQHFTGVRFHLPPKNNATIYSFMTDEELAGIYNARPHKLNEISQASLTKNRYCSFYRQTAFANNSQSGECVKRGEYKEGFVDWPIGENHEIINRVLKI